MSKQFSEDRRSFLKTSGAGAIGLAAVSVGVTPAQASPGGAWTDGKQVNPLIDNLRVTCCHDAAMVGNTSYNAVNFGNMDNQNNPVNVARVHSNLDAMAISLATSATYTPPNAPAAWGRIFQCGTKAWKDIKVAMKVNEVGSNHPRVAIIDKVCRALNALGVPYGNMIIYKGDDLYKDYVGNKLPSGVIIDQWLSTLHGRIKVDVPWPNNENKNLWCVTDIANGTIDIVVNFAVNKGHSQHESWTCNYTGAMKNHFGTIEAWHDFNHLPGVTKSQPLMGGNPVRQQLSIVDCLWSSKTGPTDSGDSDTFRLVMGTFAPAIDYLVLKKIRVAVMALPDYAITPNILKAFGYTDTQITPLDFVPVTPGATGIGGLEEQPLRRSDFSFNYPSGAGLKRVQFNRDEIVLGLTIFNLSGAQVRTFSSAEVSGSEITWNGLGDNGKAIPSGRYIIKVKTSGLQVSRSIVLQK